VRARVSAALAILVLAGCGGGNHPAADGQGTGCRTLAADAAWYSDNRSRINDMLSKLGTCGRSGAVTDGAPLALFDFDNTTARNDIGNATFFWMLRNSKVCQPAGGDWGTTRVNEQLFGVAGAAAFDQLPEPRRQAFGAGDSDGDVTFASDATALRLAINRNQIELMCRAYDNADGRRLINPMLFDPLGMSPLYPCATTGFGETNGDQAPLRRPDSSVVPDQLDRVY
jgi:hypothetical protein